MWKRYRQVILFVCLAVPPLGRAAADSNSQRVQSGLAALYDFQSIDKGVVKDVAGHPQPLDLRIADLKKVKNTPAGLNISSATIIQTEKHATRLIEAVKKSEAITVEVWFRPAKLDQRGPARIVTLSRDSGERNFTLGQEGDKLQFRLRTTSTSTNGMPALESRPKSLGADWNHAVYTRSKDGRARLYINGSMTAEENIGGATKNWADGFRLALANESSKDRPWLGTYRLVAIYNRGLSQSEVERNFHAGANAKTLAAKSIATKNDGFTQFETKIAPLLSKHCLECHDALTKKGGLDLSRKALALKGGARGSALAKGSNSLLWKRVDANEMPSNRKPLSGADKKLLKQWLDAGAPWSLERIDPAVYVHGGGAQKTFVQRLTVPEYIATVRQTLGVDVSKEARQFLPRDLRADGFSNTAYNLNTDLGHVEAYAKLAEIIVGQIDVKTLSAKYTPSRELSDENVVKVVEPLGRRLLRGPLSQSEVASYCGVSTAVAATGGDFDDAIRCIIEAIVQSPRFLYRMENQRRGGPSTPAGQYELASRLSYILWGGPPDEELLNAADKKTLDRSSIESQAKRMLRDRRAVERSRQFIDDWLNLGRLDNLRPDPKQFPNWDPRVAGDMRAETLALFEEVVWKQKRPLSDLLSAKVTFVTPRLAKHYGLPVSDKQKTEKVVRYDLSSTPGRGGLLAHGSILTVGGDDASTVTRGLFVMHELLRGVVRDPPPCVDTTPIPSKPGLSRRAVAETRLANKNCTGCHTKFEPLAFAFEKFDGLGAYREVDEHGNKLREDGAILVPGEEKPVTYRTTAELMELLTKNDRVREAFTWKVVQFALGRPLGAEDAPIVADIHRASQKGGGTYSSLLNAIVTSDLVLRTRPETTP